MEDNMFQYQDFGEQIIDRTTPQERHAAADLEKMFHADEQHEMDFEAQYVFQGLAVDLGLSQIQVEKIKSLDESLANLPWGAYASQFRRSAKEYGLSDSQITSLLNFDCSEHWG